jgi:hypothetical protein
MCRNPPPKRKNHASHKTRCHPRPCRH